MNLESLVYLAPLSGLNYLAFPAYPVGLLHQATLAFLAYPEPLLLIENPDFLVNLVGLSHLLLP